MQASSVVGSAWLLWPCMHACTFLGMLSRVIFFYYRKLKNRVAAQTARDRKKVLMTDLESRVAQLEAENRRLAMENNTLKVQTGSLALENVALKDRLSAIGGAPSKTESESGSAVSTDPLPQGQAQTLSNWTAQSLMTLGYVSIYS